PQLPAGAHFGVLMGRRQHYAVIVVGSLHCPGGGQAAEVGERACHGSRAAAAYGRRSPSVYRRQALTCSAEVRQWITTGRVFTAKAWAIPPAISEGSRIVIASAPKARPQAAKSGLVRR